MLNQEVGDRLKQLSQVASDTYQRRIQLGDNTDAANVYGVHDAHLRLLEAHFHVHMIPRSNELLIGGSDEDVEQVVAICRRLLTWSREGQALTPRDVQAAIVAEEQHQQEKEAEKSGERFGQTYRGKVIRPQTLGQARYVEALNRFPIVFAIGPAGTGKTFLAVVRAVEALHRGEVHRLILTRPAVEAGENLGFLPGDLQEKVDPYLRPLYDALATTLGPEAQRARENGLIEIAPLAYMRGRTLEDAYVLLDEAQNATPEQMKMFLTRIGPGSRMVVTGDITQVDLPRGTPSGLADAIAVLRDLPEISFCFLTSQDIVRHPLVQRIVEAYEKHSQAQDAAAHRGRAVETFKGEGLR
ncbi:MAG: PhoH family protein [Firmicutes bacterium]|nr:PhoH family protein [Bacillota bacterium]